MGYIHTTHPDLAGPHVRIRSLDELPERLDPAASLIDVRINIAGRSRVTCIFPARRSAQWRLDNCHSDDAVTNARQLADLLSGADISVVSPSG